MTKQLLSYLFPVLVMGLVVWRMVKRSQAQALKPSRLWIRPAMLAIFLALSFLHPPAITFVSVGIFVAAVVLGAGLGFLTTRHQQLSVDPATGTLISKTSPVGIAIFVAVFAGRYAFRMLVQGGQAPDKLMAHSGQVMMWTDASLFFAFALVLAQAWEIWRRAKPLLDDHAQKKADSLAE